MTFGSEEFQYTLVEDWAELPDGESFVDVCKVRVDADDTVWILNRGDHPVMSYRADGRRTAAWGSDEFSNRPHGMCLGPDEDIFCTDDLRHRVIRFDKSGSVLDAIEPPDAPTDTGYLSAPTYWEQVASIQHSAAPFNRPTDVAIGDDERLFVADGYGNARIHEFTEENDLTASWGEPGAGPGQFRVPHAVAIHNERVWVADRENSRVQIFDLEGNFLDEWIDLIRPTDFAFHDGAVFVSEFSCRVSVFDEAGSLLARWGNEDSDQERMLVAPHSVAVDSNGDVYVGEVAQSYGNVDRGSEAIRKFERIS